MSATATPTFDGLEYTLLKRGRHYEGLNEYGTRWQGVLAFIGPDTWGELDEPYAYFVDGDIGGVPQGCFGNTLGTTVTDVLNARGIGASS